MENVKNMRRGFTMIELIFVIVIIGILAAIALPKLAATRDDAKVSAEIASVKQALLNLGSEYTGTTAIAANSLTQANTSVDCFTITHPNADGNVTVAPTVSDAIACPAAVSGPVHTLAEENGILEVGGGSKTHQFGGSAVRR